jgi:ATP-binding cassette subfamily A (ABC1) protein 3
MAEGRLRCVGSSLFLKKQYGVGYTFTIVKDTKKMSQLILKDQNEINEKIKNCILKYTNHSEILSDVGAEISFRLPFESSKTFIDMFKELEMNKAEYCFTQYGISVTTLEEVFLKVAESSDEDIRKSVSFSSNNYKNNNDVPIQDSIKNDDPHDDISNLKKTEEAVVNLNGYSSLPAEDIAAENDEVSNSKSEEIDTPFVLFRKHFIALLKKRVIYGKRDKNMFVCQILLPIILCIFGLSILLLLPDLTQPDLVLNSYYFNPTYDNNDKNFVPFSTLGGEVGEVLFDRFTGASDPKSSANGGVWGTAVEVDLSYPDQFYQCAQGTLVSLLK